MTTHLPQNKFYSASSPNDADEAGASTPAPLSNGASAALSCSATDAHQSHDDVMCGKPSGRKPDLGIATELQEKAAIVSCQEPVAADLIQSSCGEASDDVGRTRKQPSMASRLTPPGPQDHIRDDLEQLLGVAGKRRRLKLPRFVPDYEGMEAAINDPGAPRLRADDPIWTDASPLFLREA